jgi:hypothetical protein
MCALHRELLVHGFFEIPAVVVEPVLPPHPAPPLVVQAFLEPRRVRRLGAAPGDAGRRHARRDAEVAVVREEGRLLPVCLDATALRRPVVGVPNGPVQPHVLPRRERGLAVVLEVANRHAVDEEWIKADNMTRVKL